MAWLLSVRNTVGGQVGRHAFQYSLGVATLIATRRRRSNFCGAFLHTAQQLFVLAFGLLQVVIGERNPLPFQLLKMP